MKSKKKKNKQNILIAYNKSIASMQGIELAMLFCHAGFSVKTILLDGAEEQISSELLKELTGHAPWSKLHKPNWVKAEINYPVGIVFEGQIPLNPPLTKGVEDKSNWIATPSARNDGMFSEYIKEHCGFIKILLNKESALNQDIGDNKRQIILLPDNPLNLRSLFEKILSETVALTAAKALDGRITYSFEGDFSKIDYVKELEKAFAEGGIEKNSLNYPLQKEILQEYCKEDNLLILRHPSVRHSSDTSPQVEALEDVNPDNSKESLSTYGGASRVIISNGKKEIEVVLEADEAEIEPTKTRIFVSRHKNGLLLIDSIETRLLPDFSCQSCYSRLVNYIKVELTRLDY